MTPIESSSAFRLENKSNVHGCGVKDGVLVLSIHHILKVEEIRMSFISEIEIG